jgi:excisionase family DNA binding protein
MTDPVRPLSYSMRDAAAALSIGLTTLNRLMSHDMIKYTRIGQALRIPASEVERVAAEGFPKVPRSYVRRTQGPTNRGRPCGSKKKKT